ncbi:MAG TPA: cyclase family protein [Vicinamibacterales bacterium]|jgi:arylformamidase|nr:cyclase family protein [Vicinamibacterales bacterium]
MQLIDVTVPLRAELPVYPGNVPFTMEPVKRIADGGSSNVSSFRMGAHSGTHVDAPRHYFDNRPGVEGLPLDLLIGRTRVIHVSPAQHLTADDLSSFALSDCPRVLIKTANSSLWSSANFASNYIGIAESGARYLVERGVKVVGVDYLSVEPFKTPGAPAHHILLGAGAIIIEGLNLSGVEPGDYDMLCLPLRIVGADGAPARVVLRSL